MKIRYIVPILFFAIGGLAADRTTAVQPEQQQLNRSMERAIYTSKIIPTLVAQFSSVPCSDGNEYYAPGDTVCRAHKLWECQKDGSWKNLNKKC